MNELEAQGLQTLQQETKSSFARPWFLSGQGLKLKISQQVMSQDADLLPGRVGAVVMGGNGIQGPLAFEFGECLLLGSSSGHEIPQRGGTECQVGAHRRVLKVAVVGIKQIQLVVLPAFMMHSLSVDDHPKGLFPSRDWKRYFKESHPLRQTLPTTALPDQRQKAQPFKERNFDRIARPFSFQKLKDLPLEKGPVHAKLQRQTSSQPYSQIVDQIAQEACGSLGVVDVAGPVLDSQNVSGLSQMREDGG